MIDPERVVRRAVEVRRIENAVVLATLRRLARLYRDLEMVVRADPIDAVSLGRRQRRVDALAGRGYDLIRDTYRELRGTSANDLRGLARWAAARTVADLADALAGRAVDRPTPQQLAAIVTHHPVQGAVLSDWWRQYSRHAQERFRRELTIGMMRRETAEEIARRIRGTSMRAPAGGLHRIAANEAETLVRTAVHEVNNSAAVVSYQANRDIVQGIEWLSTLDDRTCPQCGDLDGERWALDSEKLLRPPAHPRCRCTVLPVLIGVKPRPRVHYDQWLRAQPADRQDRILGKRRGQFWRDHPRMRLDQLIREDGEFITLAELGA